MFTETDLNDRFTIIQNASLGDAEILNEKYGKLLSASYNDEERKQYRLLRNNTLVRINQLTQKSR